MEFKDSEILGVTKAKQKDFKLGIAQNAVTKMLALLKEPVLASPPMPEGGTFYGFYFFYFFLFSHFLWYI